MNSLLIKKGKEIFPKFSYDAEKNLYRKSKGSGWHKESVLMNLVLSEMIDNFHFELTKLGAINTKYSRNSKSVYFSSIHNDKNYRLSDHKSINFEGVSIVINLETSLEIVVKQFLGYE